MRRRKRGIEERGCGEGNILELHFEKEATDFLKVEMFCTAHLIVAIGVKEQMSLSISDLSELN